MPLKQAMPVPPPWSLPDMPEYLLLVPPGIALAVIAATWVIDWRRERRAKGISAQ